MENLKYSFSFNIIIVSVNFYHSFFISFISDYGA